MIIIRHGTTRVVRTAIVVMALCAASQIAHAGHTASIGIGVGTASPINTEPAATLPRGRWVAGIRTEYTNYMDFSDAELLTLREANPEAGLDAVDSLLNVSIGGFYGVTDDLTLGLRLPYVRRTGLREPEAEEGEDPEIEQVGDPSGIGDLVLVGQYRFYHVQDKHHAAILLGVKTPTGDTDEESESGELIETDQQPGSGSWDGLFGLAYTYWFSPLGFDTSLLYTLATEGSQETKLGDAFNYNFALSYRLGGGQQGVFYAPRQGLAWDLIVEFNGEWRDTSEVDNVENPDFGGHVLYFSPGARLTVGSSWTFAVSGGVPVVTDLNGTNLADPDFRIIGSVGLSF
ncbi:MAG: transporter [Chromatiales bacterium]